MLFYLCYHVLIIILTLHQSDNIKLLQLLHTVLFFLFYKFTFFEENKIKHQFYVTNIILPYKIALKVSGNKTISWILKDVLDLSIVRNSDKTILWSKNCIKLVWLSMDVSATSNLRLDRDQDDSKSLNESNERHCF